MPKTARNTLMSNYPVVIKGTILSVATAIVACTATSYLITQKHISESSIRHMILLILLISSFVGAKYSNTSVHQNNMIVTIITGIAYILMLMIIHVTITTKGFDDIFPKTISVMGGTALASIGSNKKGRGRVKNKYRHNR